MNFELYHPVRPNSLIKKIWGVSLESFINYQMLPEASTNLVFNLGSSFSGLNGGLIKNSVHATQNFCFLSGLHTKPVIASSTCCSYVIAVEMHPMAMNAFFGISCGEVENHVINGELVLDDINHVEDKLMGPGTFIEKAKWIEHYLYSKINETSELRIAAKMNATISKMHTHLLQGKKVDMQDYTGFSRMHTHRLSTEWLGLSPKKCLRLQQFIKALDDLHFTKHLSADIATCNGYFDQSHFNRIFREFAEMTPKQYREDKSDMVGQIFLMK
jgi:AraC-like DNA-binding protein